jgi:hypothetical protein
VQRRREILTTAPRARRDWAGNTKTRGTPLRMTARGKDAGNQEKNAGWTHSAGFPRLRSGQARQAPALRETAGRPDSSVALGTRGRGFSSAQHKPLHRQEKSKSENGARAGVLGPIFVVGGWGEASSEEHSHDWLCHRNRSRREAGEIADLKFEIPEEGQNRTLRGRHKGCGSRKILVARLRWNALRLRSGLTVIR